MTIRTKQFHDIHRGDMVQYMHKGEVITLEVVDVVSEKRDGERFVTYVAFDDGTCIDNTNAGFLMRAWLIKKGED